MFQGVFDSITTIQTGADVLARIGGVIQLVANLLPWAGLVMFLIIVFNPGGIGDQWLATMRGWLRTAKDAVDGQSERLDALEAKVSSLDGKLDKILESVVKP